MAEKGRARQGGRRPARHLLAATLAGLPDRFCGPYATDLSSCDLTGAACFLSAPCRDAWSQWYLRVCLSWMQQSIQGVNWFEAPLWLLPVASGLPVSS